MMEFDIKQLIKRDFPYIIVIIFCLGAVAYDLVHQQSILDKCNEYWLDYVENAGCIAAPVQAQPLDNFTMRLWNEKEEG